MKFNDCFVVENLKIVQGSKGLFVGMPSQPDGKGSYRDMAYPVTKEFRAQLNSAVLEAYEAKLEQMAERGNTGRASISEQLKAGKEAAEQTKAETASAVFALLESCPEFQKARRVLAYHALPDELPTQAFLQQWSNGKKLYLPRVNGDELDILPYSPESLHKGAFSILEPDGNECTDVDTLDLIIVPAVAFDRRGNRLGIRLVSIDPHHRCCFIH